MIEDIGACRVSVPETREQRRARCQRAQECRDLAERLWAYAQLLDPDLPLPEPVPLSRVASR